MTVARKHIVDVQTTPLYHVSNRCVRRAFLCGQDNYSGRNYDHRRQFIIHLVTELLGSFAIYQCGFSIMSNHYHLVLRLNPAEANSWSNQEVLTRWCRIYKGHPVVQQYLAGETLSPRELYSVNELTETYRNRLSDLSWFMAKLNETIARQANKEDGCSGRFWEGRFNAQALLDNAALITSMMYVDLNPIRAGMATTLEGSDYTSVQQRILELAKSLKQARKKLTQSNQPLKKKPNYEQQPSASSALLPFLENETAATNRDTRIGIPMRLTDYLQLIDWTGRVIRSDKRGAIPADVEHILNKLSINNEKWLESVTQIEKKFRYAIGSSRAFESLRKKLSKKWLYGKRFIQEFYVERQIAMT